MKKFALSVLFVLVALFTVACGGGGLTNYFGLSTKNIDKIEYKYGGSSYKTISESKTEDFMDTFDVEYVYHNGTGIQKSNGEFMVTYDYNGTTRKVFLFIQADDTVVAQMFDGVVTIYYVTTEAVDVPFTLTI